MTLSTAISDWLGQTATLGDVVFIVLVVSVVIGLLLSAGAEWQSREFAKGIFQKTSEKLEKIERQIGAPGQAAPR